jgi:hypothetical protein
MTGPRIARASHSRAILPAVVVAGILLCAWAGSVAAAPVYAGVAARDPALEAQAERIAIALGQELDKRGVVDLGSPPLPDAVDGPDAILDQLLAASEKQLLDGDFGAALAKADEAIARFEGSGAFRAGPSWTSYARALLARSLALRRLGKESDSDATLSRMASLMPKFVPDPGMTPPKVSQKHQQLLDEIKAKPRVEIEVTSDPQGADVVVDGQTVGKTPIVVRDLFPGAHFVGISTEGERIERKLTVTSGTGRVNERVGDPRAAAVRVLRTHAAQASGEDHLLDAARDVGDDVVIGALLNDKDSADFGPLVVVGRARDGKLVVVVGTRLDKKTQASARAAELAEAILEGTGGWIGPAAPTASADTALLNGLAAGGTVLGPDGGEGPEGPAGGEEEGPPWVLVGVGAGIAAVVITGTVVAVLVSAANANKVEVTVDASNLK